LRCNKLPDIFNRYDIAQSKLEFSDDTDHTPRSHTSSTHIKLPTIALPNFQCVTGRWLHYRDSFEALAVYNTILSKVQKFHYLIASLKNGAKHLVINLKFKNKIFLPGNYQHSVKITKINFHDACQAFMSNAQSKEGDAS